MSAANPPEDTELGRELQGFLDQMCAAWDVFEVSASIEGTRRWTVVSPFFHLDGDGIPAFIEQRGGAWVLTDQGMAISHLFFEPFTMTPARITALRNAVRHAGCLIDDDSHQIELPLDAAPTVYDLGRFLQAVLPIPAVARALAGDRHGEQYTTVMRRHIVASLTSPDYEESWDPQVGGHGNYTVDLKVPTVNAAPIALFLAGTNDRTYAAAMTVDRMQTAAVDAQPVLAYRGRHGPSQNALGAWMDYAGDGSLVKIDETERYKLAGDLQRRGALINPQLTTL